MASNINFRENIYLIKNYCQQIIGSKLPSNKQVLSVLFYNLRQVKLNLRDSARLVIQEVIIFWEKARIPVREVKHCINKLEALYGEWRALQKHSGRTTESQKQKEQAFVSKFDDLFDIAHAKALEMITIEEDKQFLIAQRKKGRPGYMSGIDAEQVRKENRAAEREEKALARKESSIRELEETWRTVEMESSSSGSEVHDVVHDINVAQEVEREPEGMEAGPSKPKKRRASREVMIPKLAAAFDRCKISDRDAVHILMAAAEALGHSMQDLVINRSSIHRYRERFRRERADALKKQFQGSELEAVVVHWDGKLLPVLTGKDIADRLPVIITNGDIEQMLGVPLLEDGTGRQQATAISEMLNDWALADKVKAMCCDTTASNTGHVKGACVILEQLLERDILLLPCRHHIYEIILRSIFDETMAIATTGPNVSIFKRFQQTWSTIDKTKFKTGIEDKIIQKHLEKDFEEILAFAKTNLENRQPREDYRELLELTIIFLGDVSGRGISFRVPGAIHHARWMAKAIYCLKMFLFRDEFQLAKEERSALSSICLFIVSTYVQAWFRAPLAAEAPNHDLQFLKKLYHYKTVDSAISRVALQKFVNHLWYLGPETVALAFFDQNLSVDTKTKMLEALNRKQRTTDASVKAVKRAVINPKSIPKLLEKVIENFVTAETAAFFERFNCTEFLHQDPSTWTENNSFKKGLKIVNQLKVVNDTAERGVKLMEEYNNLITKNEDQKQYLLQVVNNYRCRFPDSKKETLLQSL